MTARKRFELSQAESSSPLLMKFLKVKGSVNSVDLDRLISEQAYQGAELRFTGAKKLSRGLAASHVDLRSNFQGIDVTGLCDRAQRPRQAHGTDREFKSLLNRTKQMRENLESKFAEDPRMADEPTVFFTSALSFRSRTALFP